MCGICGVIYSDRDKVVDKDLLRSMNNALYHRGPDDEGYYTDKGMGLAAKRLSIIDLKTGHQPVHNEDQTVHLVQNGEIYNYLELREFLLKKGHRFCTRSDTETIVHLYEELGEDFVHKLRGMFAIAIWDEKRERLILARDRLGIKPVYYYNKGGVFLFASEIKAILKHPKIEKEIRLDALSDYLTYLYIPAPKTIYRHIFKLLPAHILILKNGDISIKKYWELKFEKRKAMPEEYYKENLSEILKESVKRHLISDVPLGAFLSGGMDSSTVVALMNEFSGKPVKTFSVGFDVASHNELKFANLVAKRFGTEHEELYLKPDIMQELPKIAAHFDEPFADSSAIPTYLISQFAKKYVKVVLAGDGGDELFAGYEWTRRQKFIQDFNRLPEALKGSIRKFFLDKKYLPDRGGRLIDKLRRFIYDADLPLEESFMRRITCFPEEMKRGLFKNELFGYMEGYSSIESILPYFSMDNCEETIEKLLFADAKVYLPDDGLNKVDMMSMYHSLEVRVPFLDHELVEFTASIPFKYKMKGRISKYITKEIMRPYLPKGILKQRKQGFSVPVHSWFKGRLNSFARERLLSPDSRINEFFNAEYVKWLIDENLSGKQDFGHQIYSLLFLELWLESHL